MKLIQMSIVGMLVLVGVMACDIAVLRLIQTVPTLSGRVGRFGVLPMSNLLALFLVLVVVGLVNRGEVALARVAFLFVGGTALVLVVSIAILAPVFFFEYIELTAGPLQELLLTQSQKNDIAAGRMLPPINGSFLGGLLAWIVVTPLLLFPAIFAAWSSRRYRLKLVAKRESSDVRGTESTAEPRETHHT
jgi:hypothetical protein